MRAGVTSACEGLWLGLDVGTQGTKGLLLDLEVGVVARASASYGLLEGLAPGAAEQHPETWWEAIRSVTRELVACAGVDPGRLRGLGVSGQQHGFVPLDGEGAVLRPAKLWCDTETAPEARELEQRLGRPLPAGYTASKILWLKRHEPDTFARLEAFALPHDWVNARLTGRLATEAGDASGTGLFDPVARAFRVEDAAAIDPRLPALLPEVHPPGEPFGTLLPGPAAELGLPAGLLVAPGGGDNMCSAIGSGATVPGVVVCSLGTSGTVFAHAEEPVLDPSGAIAPFCGSTGGWLPLLCVMNLTGVTEELAQAFGRSHEELSALAADVPPGVDGLLLLPFLQGERVPDLPQATGTLLGLRPGSFAPGRLYRAALEGTAANLAWGVERLRGLGVAVDGVRVVGGGARNALWCSILASAFGVPVQRLAEPESGALGAALQAAWVAGRRSDPELTPGEVGARAIAFEGPAFEPEPALREVLSGQGARFRAEVARLYERA